MRIGSDGLSAPSPSLQGRQGSVSAEEAQASADSKTNGADSSKGSEPGVPKDQLDLSPEARAQLSKLKARDQQVRSHEAAHMAAGGSLVRGGATYTYQQGPDGGRYAVGGEVTLDTSSVPNDPKATIAKAERIRAAAMAPADPSGQDRAVAAQASAMASKAAMDLARQSNAAATAPTSGQGKAASPESKSLGSKLDTIG
jgi:hypothetical protein